MGYLVLLTEDNIKIMYGEDINRSVKVYYIIDENGLALKKLNDFKKKVLACKKSRRKPRLFIDGKNPKCPKL